MEKKKMKMWKKILIIVLIILFMIAIIALWRYNILTQIEEKNEMSNARPNYYYYLETSDMIMECWKKDNMWKVNLKQDEQAGPLITFWQNSNTDEKLVLWNANKTYSTKGEILIESVSSIVSDLNDINRFMMALTPTLYVGSTNYKDKECYCVKIDEQEEIIEKETGLMLYNKVGAECVERTYSFDIVTDEDIAKPDISEYTLKEK